MACLQVCLKKVKDFIENYRSISDNNMYCYLKEEATSMQNALSSFLIEKS